MRTHHTVALFIFLRPQGAVIEVVSCHSDVLLQLKLRHARWRVHSILDVDIINEQLTVGQHIALFLLAPLL